MLSTRAFHWLALFGSTWSHFFILPFIRHKKTGGLKVGSNFLLTVFQIFSFPGQFQLAYSIVSILLEMPKSHRNIQTLFFSTLFFSVTLVELFILQSIVSAKYRILTIMKNLMKLSKYCKSKQHSHNFLYRLVNI